MKQPIILTEAETSYLRSFVHQGKANARTLTCVRILLKMAEGWRDQAIVVAFEICQATVNHVRNRFAANGLERVLRDKVQHRRRQALSGQQAAHLIAIACSSAPDGHDLWTVLHTDVRPSSPPIPGTPERINYEYEHRGTRNLFFVVEPLAGASRGSDRTAHQAGLCQHCALVGR